MKKAFIMLMTGLFVTGSASYSYASDWDKAGKALTIIEGLRLISGGRIDVVGKIGEAATGKTYTNKQDYGYHDHKNYGQYRKYHKPHKKYVKRYTCTQEKVWVPHYRWIKKHIPEHEEYDSDYGKVIVEEHYIKIREEVGGRWEYRDSCDEGYSHNKYRNHRRYQTSYLK